MATMNHVFLIGNLTRDPEVRYLPSQVAVGDLRLAVNEKFRTRNGEETERVCYVDVTVWDKQAEVCQRYLSKGSPILVEGRLELDEWTSKEGEKRSKLRVRASRVQFLGSPRNAEFRDGDGRDGDNRGSAESRQNAPERRNSPPPAEQQPDDNEMVDDENLPF